MTIIIVSLILAGLIDRLHVAPLLFLPIASAILLDIKPKAGLNFSLLSGIVYDLVLGRRLGTTSLLLLLILAQSYFFRLRFDPSKNGPFLAISILSGLEAHLILRLPLTVANLISYIVLAYFSWLVLNQTKPSSKSQDIFLKHS